MNEPCSITVIVSPLDWGLGHAARCVPLIEGLLGKGCQVIAAGDQAPLAFLRREFEERIQYRSLPGFRIRYARSGNSFVKILTQMPAFSLSWIKEHRALRKLLNDTGATMVISDNRYGVFHPGVYNVFMTHQLSLPLPAGLAWAQGLSDAFLRKLLKNFQACWVPDFKRDPGLAGQLSHPAWMGNNALRSTSLNVHYIGPQTRFSSGTDGLLPGEVPVSEAAGLSQVRSLLPDGFPLNYDLVMLSGPEPQRSRLEEQLEHQYNKRNQAVVFLAGKPLDSVSGESSRYIVRFSHLETESLARLIREAGLVVCRPGYSSIMDLAAFGKRALMIPTPGQTEQEYLAEMMQRKGWIHSVAQNSLQLMADRKKALGMEGIPCLSRGRELLDEALTSALFCVKEKR